MESLVPQKNRTVGHIRQSWIKWFSELEYRTGNILNDTDIIMENIEEKIKVMKINEKSNISEIEIQEQKEGYIGSRSNVWWGQECSKTCETRAGHTYRKPHLSTS